MKPSRYETQASGFVCRRAAYDKERRYVNLRFLAHLRPGFLVVGKDGKNDEEASLVLTVSFIHTVPDHPATLTPVSMFTLQLSSLINFLPRMVF